MMSPRAVISTCSAAKKTITSCNGAVILSTNYAKEETRALKRSFVAALKYVQTTVVEEVVARLQRQAERTPASTAERYAVSPIQDVVTVRATRISAPRTTLP